MSGRVPLWVSHAQAKSSSMVAFVRVCGLTANCSQQFARVAGGSSTYSVTSVPTEDELEDLMEGDAVSVEPCCSLGEDGAEESGVAISSISEYEEADLGPFLMLKALLKELRSWKRADSGGRETSRLHTGEGGRL